jgi:hypothetical protein
MTVHELRQQLDALGVDSRSYNLEGLSPAASEGLVLGIEGGRWAVRSFERNHWYKYGEYETESEACALMLKLLSDPAYRV